MKKQSFLKKLLIKSFSKLPFSSFFRRYFICFLFVFFNFVMVCIVKLILDKTKVVTIATVTGTYDADRDLPATVSSRNFAIQPDQRLE